MKRTISQLQADFNWQIANRDYDNWRPLYPAAGWDRLDGGYRCVLRATNGVLAMVTRGVYPYIIHLHNFLGPVGLDYISEEDWDWSLNRRKVQVFRCLDDKGRPKIVIIPVDSEKESYWAKHTRRTQAERELEMRFASHTITFDDYLAGYEHLQEAGGDASPMLDKPPKRSANRKALLATL